MALSKLPLNSRAAVKKRFPTLAAVKSKVDDGGRARFKISRFNTLKNERINSFFAGVMAVHSSDVPSTMDCHSLVAMPASAGNRWLNNALTADLSGFAGESGIKRTNRPVRQVNKRVREIQGAGLTPNITNPRAAEYSNQLGRGSSVITDWNDVAKWAILAFTDGVEYIDEIVRRAPS